MEIDNDKVAKLAEKILEEAPAHVRRAIRSSSAGNDLAYGGGKGKPEVHIDFEGGTPLEVVRSMPTEVDGIRVRRFRMGSNREVK